MEIPPKQLAAILLLAGILLVAPVSAQAAERPLNVIIVLVDDLGWMDLSCQGSDFYRTPNIDKLASGGMRFTNGYAACAVCSPTRAALMTGRYPGRLGITDWIRADFQLGARQGSNVKDAPGFHDGGKALITPVNNMLLPHSEITLAELVEPLGYRSAFIGKWHLGGKGYLPTDQGFDLNFGGWDYGQPPSYFDPYTLGQRLPQGIPTLAPRKTGEYLTDREGDEAVRFIRANAGNSNTGNSNTGNSNTGNSNDNAKPFLLYLAHYAVHTPIQGKKDLVATYEALRDQKGQDDPVYAAMVHSVDDAMGRVLKTLDELKLTERTLIIFTGDNGGLDRQGRPTENAPLRSGKGYAYEGGIRVPWIVRWPGVTRPGSVSNEPISSIDLLPTVAAALGTHPPADRPIDGIDLRPALDGRFLPDRALYWHFPHYRHGPGHDPYSIIRDGDWKLIKFYDPPKVELYNLAEDLGERNDLSKVQPGRAGALESKLIQHLKTVGARMPKERSI